MALRSLMGASEQFDTFLCHRGEEMGSIRGRVRLHVPKDRRAVRAKVYGGSTTVAAAASPGLSLLLPLHKPSCQPHIASFLWFLNDPWLDFMLADVCRPLPLLAPD